MDSTWIDDGTVSVWAYDLAVATNRLPEMGSKAGSSSQALQPICRLQGSACLEGLDCSMFLSDDDDDGGEGEEGGDVVNNGKDGFLVRLLHTVVTTVCLETLFWCTILRLSDRHI